MRAVMNGKVEVLENIIANDLALNIDLRTGDGSTALILAGESFMIYICNFHVLSHLLLIYICKLHWNLNTMFVCQVNYF